MELNQWLAPLVNICGLSKEEEMPLDLESPLFFLYLIIEEGIKGKISDRLFRLGLAYYAKYLRAS